MVVSRGGYLRLDPQWATQEFYSWNCFNCEQTRWHYYVAGKEFGETDIIYAWKQQCGQIIDCDYEMLCKECYERFRSFAKEKGAIFDHSYDD